jgi:hypothetical protein
VRTRAILNSLFPSWLPGAFKVMFSRPLPTFSCQLNALATALTCQWLMGPSKVNDVELDDGTVGAGLLACWPAGGLRWCAACWWCCSCDMSRACMRSTRLHSTACGMNP